MNGHFLLGMVGSHPMVCLVLSVLSSNTHAGNSKIICILIPLALVWCQFYSSPGCTGTASAWINEATSLDNSWFYSTESFTCGSYV